MSRRLGIHALAERPDLEAAMWELRQLWPEFMLHDATADLYYDRCTTAFADLVFVVEDPDEPGVVQGRAFSVPFAARGDELPADGWDAVVRWGVEDLADGRATDEVSALEIAIRPEHRGTGLAGRLIAAMRDAGAGRGARRLVAPVRPTRTAPRAEVPVDDDGLPIDPWLRTHVRLGATIERIAPRSMVITGSLAEWRTWTGQPFDSDGPTQVEGGLAPVLVSVAQDLGVYVEPNVWVSHPVR